MSSEVCPFCGKTYKRLKSHLPHCKAAASSKSPPSKNQVKTNQTSSSSQQVAAGSSEPGTRKKSTRLLSEECEAAMSSKSFNTSPQTSTKKKKLKLSEQIKMANTAIIPAPTPSLPPSLPPSTSKPKKQSLRSLIEAAKSDQVTKGSTETKRSGSVLFLTDPLRSTAQIDTDIIPNKTSVSTETKNAPKKKVFAIKSNVKSLSTTKHTDFNSEVKVNRARSDERENVSLDDTEDSSVSKMFKSRSGHQTTITIQDVKAMLGRAKTSRTSVLGQVQTTENQTSKTRSDSGLSPGTVPAENQILPSVSLQQTQLLSIKKTDSKSLIPLEQDSSSEPKRTLLPTHLSPQVNQASPLPRPVSLNMSRHMTELLSTSAPPPPSFHLYPLASLTALTVRVESPRVDDGLKLVDRKQNTARTEGSVTQQRLGQVRLKELPDWLACRAPRKPTDVVEMVQKGWRWYYRRYIDVKKGGVGGLGILLAGYCVLSYIWSFPHIKRDRWRKYH